MSPATLPTAGTPEAGPTDSLSPMCPQQARSATLAPYPQRQGSPSLFWLCHNEPIGSAFSEGCVIGNGWRFISWDSKEITNKVPPSWSPSAEKLEKKSLFSASCWNKTTICYDRAFLKRTTTNRWNASALGPTTEKQGKRAVFSPYTERKQSYSMTEAINSIPWKALPFLPYRHKGKARYSMWLFHLHSMVKREAFFLIFLLMDSMIGGFYWLFPWHWGK